MSVRGAVIGLGIGRVHAGRLAKMEDVRLVAVADTNGQVARQVAGELSAKAYEDGADLLKQEELDFVSVCTTPATHLALTSEAARRRVHVICEKPMAPTLEGCDAMIAACHKARVKLMIAQKKRFEPAYRLVKERSAAEFGPVRWATVKYALGRVPKPWFWSEADGGGPIQENTIHMVDMLRFLIGEVKHVYAEGGNMFNPERREQIDVAAATFRFRNGAVAALGAGQASEWGFATETMTLSHDNAVVEVSGQFDSPFCLRYVLKDNPAKVVEANFAGFDPFHAELRHFVDCIQNDTEPLVPGEEGRASVAVCLAIKESIRTGRAVAL